MTPKEIREKQLSDLGKVLHDLREELFKFKMQGATGQLEKSHRVKELKKDIARVLTVMNEKKRAA